MLMVIFARIQKLLFCSLSQLELIQFLFFSTFLLSLLRYVSIRAVFLQTHTHRSPTPHNTKMSEERKQKNNNTHSLSLIKDFSGRARKKTEKKPTVPSYCYSHTANLLCTRRRWNIFFLSRETLAIREKGRSEWTTTKREKKKQQEK